MERRHWIILANILIWGKLAFYYIEQAIVKGRIGWLIMGVGISMIPVIITGKILKSEKS